MKPYRLYYKDVLVSEHISLRAAQLGGKKFVSNLEKKPIKKLAWSLVRGQWWTYWEIRGFLDLGDARLKIKLVQE